MPLRLLYRIIKFVLCHICISLIPFFSISYICYYNLSPFITSIVTINLTSVIFSFYCKQTIFRNNNMIYLSGTTLCSQHYII